MTSSEIAAKLAEAARTYIRTRDRVFRFMPVGAPGSSARIQQDAEIAAENALDEALAAYDAQFTSGLTNRSNEGQWDSRSKKPPQEIVDA